MTTLYLDANIIIQGGIRPEHITLRDMAKRGEIRLLISPEIQVEQEAQSLEHYFGDLATSHRIPKNLTAKEYREHYSGLTDEIAKQESLRQSESGELLFWKGCNIDHAASTFAGLIAIAVLGPQAIFQADVRREAAKLGNLRDSFHLGKMDAFHVMHAESAGCDYLLTWDKDLIKACLKVPWLSCKVADPAVFLKSVSP